MRSHDLNRLLDEPGPYRPLLKLSFAPHRPQRTLEQTEPNSDDDSSHHCNGALPREGVFRASISRVVLFLAELSHSTHWALMRWC